MEVHPPEHPIHTWRDFLIHIATIVTGLLIAIGLEQTVEKLHQQHLLHQAEANLRAELELNARLLKKDKEDLDATQHELSVFLNGLRGSQAEAMPSFRTHWEWNDVESAAWSTARDSGAVGLMRYDTAQNYADLYQQQTYVNEQALVFIRDVYRDTAPFQIKREVKDLTPAERMGLVTSLQQTIVDMDMLRALTQGLEDNYKARLRAQ